MCIDLLQSLISMNYTDYAKLFHVWPKWNKGQGQKTIGGQMIFLVLKGQSYINIISW